MVINKVIKFGILGLALFINTSIFAQEQCPNTCRDRIYYFDGIYNVRTAACDYTRQSCENGCSDRGCISNPTESPTSIPTNAPVNSPTPTPLPVPVLNLNTIIQPFTTPVATYNADCPNYCKDKTSYSNGKMGSDGKCAYSVVKCESNCNMAGKACLNNACLNKCTGNFYYYEGEYVDQYPLAKGCVYKELQCSLGCNTGKKECKRCTSDTECKNSCKLGEMSIGKCYDSAPGDGCVFSKNTCATSSCSLIKKSLCEFKIGPAYFTDPLDGKVKPIPEAKVNLSWSGSLKNGIIVEKQLPDRATDSNGNIDISQSELNALYADPKTKLTVTVNLEDFKGRFKIIDVSKNSTVPSLAKTFYVNNPETYVNPLDFNFNSTTNNNRNAKIYYHNWEAMRFAEDVLKTPINYFIPEPVKFNNSTCAACHNSSIDPKSPSDKGISYNIAQSSLINQNSAENLEWHEFCHHIMADEFNYIPWEKGNINHKGFTNPTSGDAWLEGWAEFCGLMVKNANNYNYNGPGVYSTFGNMETNFTVFSNEEFAVASLLWDLFDPATVAGGEGDGIQLTVQQIWNILRAKYTFPGEKTPSNIKNMADIYWALNQSNLPGLKDDIDGDGINNLDALFIVRGDFADNNNNSKWDKGEIIGKTVSAATGALRPNHPRKPGAYLRLNVTGPDGNVIRDGKAKVKVVFNNNSCGLHENCDYEYDVLIEEGLIHFEPPPANFDTTVNVDLVTNGKTIKIATLKSQEYWKKYDEKKEFVYSYNLKVMNNIKDLTGLITLSEAIRKAEALGIEATSSVLLNINNKPVYRIIGIKQTKLLALYKVHMDMLVDVDARTGKVIEMRKPWWSIFTLR